MCELTGDQVELLGTCPEQMQVVEDRPADDRREDAAVERDDDEQKDPPARDDDTAERDNDDSGVAPVGGIETGAGGTAGTTAAPAPGWLGGLSVVGFAALLAWRRRLGIPG